MIRSNDTYGDVMKYGAEFDSASAKIPKYLMNQRDAEMEKLKYENAKVNTDALIPHDVMVRREAERQLAELKMAMRGEMRVPTKEEAELLLKPFNVQIVGSEYGWSFSETAIRLHNGEIVFRSPEVVFHLYSVRTSLRNIRIKAMYDKGEAKPCAHGGLHYSDGSSECYKCHPEKNIPTKSLPTI